MSITVGTDTYATLEEITTILSNYFDTDNFDNASTANQEKAAKQATRNIDSLRLMYQKYDYSQALEFPRNECMQYLDETLGVVGDIVKEAQALETLKILDDRANPDTIKELQTKGIKSQSIEGTSVTFDGLAVQREINKQDNLISKDARKLLRPYIQSSYSRW